MAEVSKESNAKMLDILEHLCHEVQKMSESQRRIENVLITQNGSESPGVLEMKEAANCARHDARSETPILDSLDGVGMPFLLPETWPRCLDLRVGLEVSHRCEFPKEQRDALSLPEVEPTMPVGGTEVAVAKSLHVFQIVSVLVLVLELTVLPVVLAWQVAASTFTIVLTVVSLFFWTTDLALNCFARRTVLDPHNANLASTWRFVYKEVLLDLAILLADCFSFIYLLTGSGNLAQVKLLRAVKLQRLFRLVRMFRQVPRVRQFLDTVESHADYFSNTLLLGVRVTVILLFFLWLYHVIACMFFAVADYSIQDTGYTWLDLTAPVGSTSYSDSGMLYQYMTSLHWSMAQSSVPGITGANSWERLFACLTKLLDKVFNVTIIPALAAAMIGFQLRASKETQQIGQVRLFLKHNGVKHDLGVRVCSQIKERQGALHRTAESDVVALSLLSPSLLYELRYSILRQHMVTHPLFLFWTEACVISAQELCGNNTAELIDVSAEDDLFLAVQECHAAYYIASGAAVYRQDPQSSPVSSPTVQDVEQGCWLCEVALWVKWTHVGTLTFPAEAQVVAIDALKFIQVAQRHRLIWRITQAYAEEFHRRLTATGTGAWPTDIHVPCTDFDDIISSLPQDVIQRIGACAVSVQLSDTLNPFAASMLRSTMKEVKDGKYTVIRTQDGEILRIIRAIEVQIKSPQGLFLLELATLSEGALTVRIQWPGTERLPGQSSQDACAALLLDRFPHVPGHMFGAYEQKQQLDREVVENQSVKTVMLKALHVVPVSNTQTQLGQEVDVEVPFLREGQGCAQVIVVRGSPSRAYLWCSQEEGSDLKQHACAPHVEEALLSVMTELKLYHALQ